jgi:hypothetical protein
VEHAARQQRATFRSPAAHFRFQEAVIRSDWHGQFSDKKLPVGRLMGDGHEKDQ